jgi:hypothetical protein
MIIDVHKHSDWHKHNQNELSINTDKYGIGKTWLTNPVIKRYPGNPILSADDVPYRSDLVFNAGVTKYQGKYVMVFRNDYADSASKIVQGCNLGLAFSNDGINWKIEKQPLFLDSGSYPFSGIRPGKGESQANQVRQQSEEFMCSDVDIRSGL